MSNFVLRYYYFREDQAKAVERMAHVLKNKSLDLAVGKLSEIFQKTEGYFFYPSIISARYNILGIKTPADTGSWKAAWNLLEKWEQEAGLAAEEMMGRLTLLVDCTKQGADSLAEASLFLPGCQTGCGPVGSHPIRRLSIEKCAHEAVYLYNPNSSGVLDAELLNQRLPLFHCHIIDLQQVDANLAALHRSVSKEKEEMETNLNRILVNKFIAGQSASDTNAGFEQDIEELATAFARLVADKTLVVEGIKRLNSMLDNAEAQFLKRQVMEMDSATLAEILEPYRRRLEDLKQTYAELEMSEDNYHDVIEVVKSKIQVMYSRTNILTQGQIKELLAVNVETQNQIRELLAVNVSIQKKSLMYQYAAGLIEFIVLAYYSHSLWLHLAHRAAEVVPVGIQLFFVMIFSGCTVLLTHYLSEYMQGENKVRKKLLYTGLCLAIVVLVIIMGTTALGAAVNA